jgi:hypothetical protein
MSVLCRRTGVCADNFGHKSGAGFVRAYDARAARQQILVSIMLVLVLALAAVALGMLTPLAPGCAPGRSSAVKPSSRQIAETLLDIRG